MAEPQDSESTTDPRGAGKGEVPGVPSVRSEDFLQGGRELRIIHGGETYRLLVTRNNKLLLQK